MLWLLVTISAYFLLAIVFLVDKYLLTGPIPNPKVYAFYVGILGLLVLLLGPFVGFYIPEIKLILLSLVAGALFIYALFWFYKSLNLFEASRIVPAIGGLVPLFTFGLIYLFSKGKETLSLLEGLAFILLVLGSVLIVWEKEKFVNLKSLKNSLITAFFFSLSFVLVKYVYLALPFWTGFIWTKIGGFLTAIFFLLFATEVKKEIFKFRQKGRKLNYKIAAIFVSNQGLGAGVNILQNWAIALVPLAYVVFINALQSIQYAFLFLIIIFLSKFFPHILKEELTPKIVFQKIISIFLISLGILILFLKK